ncbi:MAG: hypothetical protein AAF959_09875 [Cyanobacteria bacterium P01_D01_bin.56]
MAQIQARTSTTPLTKTAVTGGALTVAPATGISLFAPVASNPAGATLALGAGALGAGFILGNSVYEGLGRPFGPSLGDYIRGSLNRALGGNPSKGSETKNSSDEFSVDDNGDNSFGTNLQPGSGILEYEAYNAPGDEWYQQTFTAQVQVPFSIENGPCLSASVACLVAVWDGGSVQLTGTAFTSAASRIKVRNLSFTAQGDNLPSQIDPPSDNSIFDSYTPPLASKEEVLTPEPVGQLEVGSLGLPKDTLSPKAEEALELQENLVPPLFPGIPALNKPDFSKPDPPESDPPSKPTKKKGSPCGCNGGILSGVSDLLDSKISSPPAGNGLQLTALQAQVAAVQTTVSANNAQSVGILAKLQLMQQFAEKAWKNTHADKLINLLTLMTVLHNASMVSRDIGETLGYVVSNALAVVGVKDEDGNALDINGLVGSSVSNFVKSVVGEDVYNDTRVAWQKANRVLQAGSNIIWTIRNINDATQDVLEWTAENTGKIGNALKKYGVVGDRAYPWMSERVQAQDFYRRKFSRVFQGLEQAEDTASSLAVVTGNVREIQEEVTELGEARQRFTDAIEDIGPDDIPGLPENAPIATEQGAAEQASQSPDVTIATDAQKGDPPTDATP